MTDLISQGVSWTFTVVAAAIIIDTVLGVIKAAKLDYESFDFKVLPKYLVTGIVPYVGGLGILAIAAHFIGEPFSVLFYASSSAVTLKYIADIKIKLNSIFGTQLSNDGGIGGDQ